MNEILNKLEKLNRKACKKREVPISAVVVKDNKIISCEYNKREKFHDITAHAEVLAIRKAAKKLKRWNLSDCILYVSLKPCSMCSEVIKQSRIKTVYYFLDKLENKKEYDKTKFLLVNEPEFMNSYQHLLSDFFKNKR